MYTFTFIENLESPRDEQKAWTSVDEYRQISSSGHKYPNILGLRSYMHINILFLYCYLTSEDGYETRGSILYALPTTIGVVAHVFRLVK